MKKFLSIFLMFGWCLTLAGAEEARLLQRSEDLVNTCRSGQPTEFARLLERSDQAYLDGRAVRTAVLHEWLQHYIGARTVGEFQTNTIDSSARTTQSVVAFEEQEQPLVLNWVRLKEGEYYLRGVEAPGGGQAQTSPRPAEDYSGTNTGEVSGARSFNGLPEGVQIDANGISAPGVEITSRGITAEGVEITPDGIFTSDGFSITPAGITGPGGLNIGADFLRRNGDFDSAWYQSQDGFRLLQSLFR
jgi:hypothetical protein